MVNTGLAAWPWKLALFFLDIQNLGDLSSSRRMKSEWRSGIGSQPLICNRRAEIRSLLTLFCFPKFISVLNLSRIYVIQVIILLRMQGHLSKNFFYKSWKDTNLAWSAVQLFVHGSQTADNVKHICWYAWSSHKLKGKFLFIYSSWTLSLKNDHHSFCMAEYYYSKRISAWALIDTILQLRCMVEAMVTSVFKQERSVPVKSFSTPPRAFQQWRSKNPNNDVGHNDDH